MQISKISIPQKSLQRFCKQYRVQRLALFGSVLRDDFGPESDIDILVLFQPDTRVGFLTLGKMQRELSAMFNRQVDLVPQKGLKPIIREAVLASAQEVYAA
jgi:predicted nucleotidyltransferase